MSDSNPNKQEKVGYRGSTPDLPETTIPDPPRPPGFVEVRRKICDSPHLCFEFGDVDPVCGPCDRIALIVLNERERCAEIARETAQRASAAERERCLSRCARIVEDYPDLGVHARDNLIREILDG